MSTKTKINNVVDKENNITLNNFPDIITRFNVQLPHYNNRRSHIVPVVYLEMCRHADT